MKKKKKLLRRNKTALLVIDVQERLMPVIHENERVFKEVNKLIEGAGILGISSIVTEQYPKGLGNTCEEIKLPEGADLISKTCFSCMLSEDVLAKLDENGTKDLILCGVETHICVLKTALDALARGFRVHVVADATSSRLPTNWHLGLERMKQSGAFIVSTEMVLFQLMDYAGNDEFKKISKLIK